MRLTLLLLVAALVLVPGLGACKPTASAPPPSQTPSIPLTGKTIGELAQTGGNVFADRCARCHGSSGQGGVGPAIVGEQANLDKYQNAGLLFQDVSTRMPRNAPGQLSQEEYMQVVSHLLLQNSFVSAGTAFNSEELAKIQLGR